MQGDSEKELIIPIRGPGINYLNIRHLSEHSNVTLVAENGSKIRVNNLQLAAFSQAMLETLQDDQEESVITTNLDHKDLVMVANFITEGLLPIPVEKLKVHVPENVAKTFKSFGIFLDKILKNDLFIKAEEPDVKLEDDEFLQDFLEGMDDEDLPLIIPQKKRAKKVKKDLHGMDSEDSNDEDWTPNRSQKKRPKINLEYKSDLLDDLLNLVEKKPNLKKHKKSGLSRSERDLKNQCEKFLWEYKDFAYLSIPDESKPETKAFETYHLPNDIDSYRSQPKRLDKLNSSVQDMSHPYGCSLCPAWLNSTYALKNHQLLYHSEHFQCSICKFVGPLDQPDDFRLHMFRHESRKHECIHCGWTTGQLKALETHFKNEGPYHRNKCTQCPATFSNHSEYQNHVNASHNGKWRYMCGMCQEAFDIKGELKEHKNREHRVAAKPTKTTNQSKMCDLCGKEVSSLATHNKVHHEEDLQKCPECPKICKTKYHLDDHIKGTHSRIPCEHCGLMIPIRRKERHIQQAHVNPEDRKFKCDTCGKGFTDRQKLNDHINTHTGERPYLCKYCGKGFANHGNQRAHIRQAHLGQKRNYRK